MSSSFWTAVAEQLAELKSASNARSVVDILSPKRNPYGANEPCAAHGFFAGGGGDVTVSDALEEAGWDYVWSEAPYHYCMKAPDGSEITYVEGDIYLGNTRS